MAADETQLSATPPPSPEAPARVLFALVNTVRTACRITAAFLVGLGLGLLVAVLWARSVTGRLDAKRYEEEQLRQQLDELKEERRGK